VLDQFAGGLFDQAFAPLTITSLLAPRNDSSSVNICSTSRGPR